MTHHTSANCVRCNAWHCGHASMAMTARYAHMDQSTMRGAMAVLNRKK